MDLGRIVKVTISRQLTTPTMESFSGILIAAEFLADSITPAFTETERVREYGSLDEIVAAGFLETSYVYLAAQAIFAQNPAVDKVYVGRRLTGEDGAETWTETLDALKLANDSWYGLVVDTRIEDDQKLIAEWVESNKKLCILASGNPDTVDAEYNEDAYLEAANYKGSDVIFHPTIEYAPVCLADYLKAANYERSAVIYHPDADMVMIDAAWIGKLFAKAPGGATWAYKTLAGIPVYSLTPAQINRAAAKNANIYVSAAGVAITLNGTVGSGEYLDIIHGLDWLEARIQNLVYTPLVQQDKIPFTDGGAQIIVSQLKAALQEGKDASLLASYEVTVPAVISVPANKKMERTLPNVRFTGVIAGAIHKTEIQGQIIQ